MRLIVLLLGLVAAPALAEENPLEILETANDLRGWEAVGRIDMDGRGMCTGTLIAPDLVLTAAHCLYDGQSGERLGDGTLRFLAGWRNGRALAERTVRRAVAHPDYDPSPETGARKSGFDLALLVLDQPIRASRIAPIPAGTSGPLGPEVGIVSYAHDRSDAPALEKACAVIGVDAGLAVMSCSVDFGSSGAPVFQIGPAGPEIVSVVSAKADYEGTPVAVGVLVDEPLARLRQIVAESGFGDSTLTGAHFLSAGERSQTGGHFLSVGERSGTGGHFVRP